MYCPKCNYDYPDDAHYHYCTSCGGKLLDGERQQIQYIYPNFPPSLTPKELSQTNTVKQAIRNQKADPEINHALVPKKTIVKPTTFGQAILIACAWLLMAFIASAFAGPIGYRILRNDMALATPALWGTLLLGIKINWKNTRVRYALITAVISLFTISFIFSSGSNATSVQSPQPTTRPLGSPTRTVQPIKPTTKTFIPTPTIPEFSFCPKVSLRIRSGPGTNFNMLDGLAVGECYRVLGRNAESTWLYLGNGGWVIADPKFIDLFPPKIIDLPVYKGN